MPKVYTIQYNTMENLQWLRRDATADSSINDQLIKMHSTHSWIKCVLRPSISYFVVCYFQHKNI